MCGNCGCSETDSIDHHHDHDNHNGHHHHKHQSKEHHHGKEHHHHGHDVKEHRRISIETSVHHKNEQYALKNRQFFNNAGLYVVNLISSPGSGKTTIVEYLARYYKDRMAVVVGDIQTNRDAERAKAAGCRSVQIETLGACHLDAHGVGHACEELEFAGVKLLVIENVGNLVCPSTYDLGEHEKIAVLSLPEGDDKVMKYPSLFHNASTILINKIDLEHYVSFDCDKVINECKSLNRSINVFKVAARTGLGMDDFIGYINGKLQS